MVLAAGILPEYAGFFQQGVHFFSLLVEFKCKMFWKWIQVLICYQTFSHIQYVCLRSNALTISSNRINTVIKLHVFVSLLSVGFSRSNFKWLSTSTCLDHSISSPLQIHYPTEKMYSLWHAWESQPHIVNWDSRFTFITLLLYTITFCVWYNFWILA